jgi:hypothetical protein
MNDRRSTTTRLTIWPSYSRAHTNEKLPPSATLFSPFRPVVLNQRKANILLLMPLKARLFAFSLQSQAIRLTLSR